MIELLDEIISLIPSTCLLRRLELLSNLAIKNMKYTWIETAFYAHGKVWTSKIQEIRKSTTWGISIDNRSQFWIFEYKFLVYLECVHVHNSWNQSGGIILPSCLSGRIIGRYKKIGKHLTGSIQTPRRARVRFKNCIVSPEIKKPQASILIWSGEYKFDESRCCFSYSPI